MNPIYQPSPREQLDLLREQTRLTGLLHEAQVLQLKMWPMVVFDGATGSGFTWDVDKKQVVFTIDLVKARKKPKLEWWKERVTILNTWVHVLLGDEWVIRVKADGKTYNGQRKINAGGNRTDSGGQGSPAL